MNKQLAASVLLASLLTPSLAATGLCAPSASPALGNHKTRAAVPLLKVDFKPFMRKMQRRIEANWSAPERSSLVRVKFTVNRKGSISNIQLLESSGKSGFIDKTGKFVIDPKYNLCGNFADGLAPVQLPPADTPHVPKRNELRRTNRSQVTN